MAVAAHEGRAYVYTLKSMWEMKTEFEEKALLAPIKEASIRSTWFVHTPRLMTVSL